MAGSDAEHVYYSSRNYPPHHRRHFSQPSNDPQSHQPDGPPQITSSSPLLNVVPATYDPSSAVASRPQPRSLSTNKEHGPHDDPARRRSDSPDPHEYYRRCRDPFGVAQNDFLSKAGFSPIGADSGMIAATYPRSASLSSVRSDGSPSPRGLPSPEFPRPFRSVSGASTNSFGQSSFKPEPALSAQARSRQSSLRELVEKFNNTVDEVPPVPSPASSRVASRTVSPTEGVGGYSRPRASSITKSGTYQQDRQDWSAQRGQSAFKPVQRDSTGSTSFPSGLNQSSGGANGAVSQSFVDLNRQSEFSRRPLFGELLVVDTAVTNPGYGIAWHSRRRGSDGSMQSPSPRFLDSQFDRSAGVSPSSPTAWYLGYTQSLEAINTDTNNHKHRRVRSDFSWNNSHPAITGSLNTEMAVAAASLQPASLACPETPHSKSRIPISTYRLGNSPDSGSSSPTKVNSPTGPRQSNQVSLPPKGTSLLPKLSKSPTRARNALAPLDITRETTHNHGRLQQPEQSPRLQAYISAPPPKKSPPLRSSRPRQPVSSATTSASRAKVVERVSNFQNQNNNDTDTRNSRSRTRRLPELNNVDFAARRQKIQQAFNKTVQENARREEEAAELQRRAKAKEDAEKRAKAREEEQQYKEAEAESRNEEEAGNALYESVGARDEHGRFMISEESRSPVTPQLKVDTTSPTQPAAQQARFDSGDSPTLGLADDLRSLHGIGRLDTQSSDIAPPSAVTAETNDTDTTSFDTEPQAGLLQPTASHRTVLSQIMQMRESSPSSSTSSGYDLSDDDDGKESIQIMLRDSAYFDDSVDCSDSQEQHEGYEQQDHISTGQQNRWSISTFSSSVQHQHSTEEDLQTLDDFPLIIQDDTHPSSSPEELNKTPQPWSAPSIHSSTTDQLTGEPFPSKSCAEKKTEVVQRHHSQGFLSPPSLARQGGWDSKRITQLYLEELTRGTSYKSAPLTVKSTETSPEPARADAEGDASRKTNSLTDDPVLVPRFEDLPESDRIDHGASLVLRDDWEHASPSIADWMQIAADEGTIPQLKEDDIPVSAHESVPTPRVVTSEPQPPLLEETGDGLGLAIHVHYPEEGHSSLLPPPPPPPDHSPPPPPSSADQAGSGPAQSSIEVSPSIYSDHPPSSTIPDAPVSPKTSDLPKAPQGPVDYEQGARSSEESSLHQVGSTPSPKPLDSSATSQRPSSGDQTSAEIKQASPSPEQRRLKKRRHVIKELVDTEYTFGRDMKVVEDIYKGTSSSCLDLSAEDVRTLFGNSDQIVHFSMTFQDALKEAARSVYVMPKSQRWSSKRSSRATQASPPAEDQSAADQETSDLDKDRQTFIGEAFMANMAQMEKVYADYLKNHDSANKKLEALQKNPKVAIWLKECREWASDLTSAWNLDSLLVKPVQRILKYPLLLTELLDSTPNDHPDREAIAKALEGVTSISVRINELKKRADLVGQVVGRKRKESDVRAGLSKAFGRRTEKLKQHVGLSDMFEDKDYNALSQKFGDSFFQLQVVMRDVEMYTREVQSAMNRFNDFVAAIEGWIDVAQSNYSELESKWRRFRMCVREVMGVALPDHLATVRKSVIDPMVTLLKLHEGPQRVMHKRNKRLMDYARFKAIKDRGDKPDKKTIEQGEQFIALNEALKDELPKLFSLTAKLMEACLNNFVQIQVTWFNLLQKKLGFLMDQFPDDIQKIVSDWSSDYTFTEAQVLSLGVCNGSILADAVNLVNFNTPSSGTDITSPRRPSTVNSSTTRTTSFNTDGSPKVSHDYSNGSIFVQSPPAEPSNGSQPYAVTGGRTRANSAISGRRVVPESSEASSGQALQSVISQQGPSTRRDTESEPFQLPRLSLDTPFLQDLFGDSDMLNGADTNNRNDTATSPGGRYSGFFSSAMPMSDSPSQAAPPEPNEPKEPKVLFLAASIYEFNIDRARREAGYPYLTYVAGEIFDVIGEKGELWLAKNQDDPTHQIGWIWNKHFAKLAT